MKNRNYLEIIRFCAKLSFSQLKAFREMYKADKNLQEHYEKLDPTNTFNPGIGFTRKESSKNIF